MGETFIPFTSRSFPQWWCGTKLRMISEIHRLRNKQKERKTVRRWSRVGEREIPWCGKCGGISTNLSHTKAATLDYDHYSAALKHSIDLSRTKNTYWLTVVKRKWPTYVASFYLHLTTPPCNTHSLFFRRQTIKYLGPLADMVVTSTGISRVNFHGVTSAGPRKTVKLE